MDDAVTESVFLRRALLADAAVSGATGIAMMLGANPVGELLGLAPALLRWAGLSLLPFVALLVYLATRERPSPSLTRVVVAANLLWSTDSVLLLVSGWAEPTALGYACVAGQALAVALFAALQYVGLRNTAPTLRDRTVGARTDAPAAP